MISKERIIELINSKKPIYVVGGYIYKIYVYKWSKWDFIGENNLYNYKSGNMYNVKNLYATEEDALWNCRFGHIERTETLSLPSWEQVGECYDLMFHNAKGKMFSLIVENYGTYPHISVSCENDYDGTFDSFEKEATKENYIKACEICKRLFLGEKL